MISSASVTNPPDPSQEATTPPSDPGDKTPPRKRPRVRGPPSRKSAAPVASTTELLSEPTALEPPGPMHQFPIQPLNRFQGAAATIKRPSEVAHFSYDDDHKYRDDDSSINYYVPPPMGVDLKEGFETFRHHEDKEDAHLDGLLKALVDKEKQNPGAEKTKADFVTWRGMMTKIMTAPYDRFAEFSMFATLHDGTIYIEEDFPSRAAQRAAESSRPSPLHQNPNQPSHKMMTFWGYKFETLALIPTPPSTTPRAQIEVHQRSIVSNHAQHCSVVRTSFGSHSLLLGGEVDGLLSPKPSNSSDPIPWVELKTAEELPPPQRQQHRDILRFERKLLKFWAQSFLLGVPTVIVGFRSKTGILRGLQTFSTHEIPGMVRRGTGCWNGNVCINFAAALLGWLKEVVRGEGVWSVVLRKGSGVVEVRRVRSGTGGIVSREFLQWRGAEEGMQMQEEKPAQGMEGSLRNGDEE